MKRSIRGTHVHVSQKHLWKYVSEFSYRRNFRFSHGAMFNRLVAAFVMPRLPFSGDEIEIGAELPLDENADLGVLVVPSDLHVFRSEIRNAVVDLNGFNNPSVGSFDDVVEIKIADIFVGLKDAGVIASCIGSVDKNIGRHLSIQPWVIKKVVFA